MSLSSVQPCTHTDPDGILKQIAIIISILLDDSSCGGKLISFKNDSEVYIVIL